MRPWDDRNGAPTAEVLVVLPTAGAGPLLAVPGALLVLREVLVSALREWTALAGGVKILLAGELHLRVRWCRV